jgi:NADH-ubiquinone oxidoreductase chain 2
MIFTSILTLIVAKALPSLYNNISNTYFIRISAIVFIYAGVLSLNTLYIQSIGSGIGIYSGLFHVTNISVFIEFFLLIIASMILVAWPLYKNNTLTSNAGPKEGTDYSLIVLFSTLGSCLLISSSDLISMYLSIELQSFGLYVLATLYRDSESSTKAGLKYFLLGGLSSCLILLGSGLIYAYTGLTNFESIYSLISASEYNNIIQGLYLGIIIIIIGFLFKVSAAPLHNWSPDVYDETPTIVTIWLTIMPKIAILVLLLELITHTDPSYFVGWLQTTSNLPFLEGGNIKNLLLVSSLLSLIIGTVVGLAQTRIKRLLAYSTISHIGFILLALLINSEQSIDSLLFYIVQYSLTNLNIFLILIGLSYMIKSNSGDIRYISELKGQFFLNPILSISLLVCLFSMAGIPPLIGFFSKQFVLYSAIQSGYYFISLVAIIVSVISASYYLKVIKVLQEEVNNTNPDSGEGELALNNNKVLSVNTPVLTNFHSFLISTLTLSILLFIFKPSLILNSTQLLSLSLFNF